MEGSSFLKSAFRWGGTQKKCHESSITKIILLTASNSFLTFASGDNTVKIWDDAKFTLTREILIGDIGSSINDMKLDYNFKFLIAGSTDEGVRIYDCESLIKIKEWKKEGMAIGCVDWMPLKKLLITAGSFFDQRLSKYKYIIRVRRVEV